MPDFIGIDFSGARYAGRKIWTAEAESRGGALFVTSLERIADRRGVSSRLEAALPALVEYISPQPGATVGIDFPFSLPQCALGAQPWKEFVMTAVERFADCDELRWWCWRQAGDREILRETERVAATPFAAYNRWIKFQAFYGITQVIAPLLTSGAASFPPMLEPRADKPSVVEVCPASTIKSLGMSSDGYKGRSKDRRDRRAEIIAALSGPALKLCLPPELERKALDNADGDALDAVIAAVAASRAGEAIANDSYTLHGPVDEGHVFV